MANVTNRGSRTNPKWYGKYRDPSAKGGWRQKHTRQLTRAADPWHALRHSLATHLTSATGDEHWASLMLGHASSTPRVTRGYVHHGAQPLHLRLLHEALCRLSFEPAAAGVTPITRARGARGERR